MKRIILVIVLSLMFPISATATEIKKFKNCTELNKVYPHGVAKKGYSNKGGTLKGKPLVNNKIYKLNSKSDRDKDGIACER